LGKRDKDKGGKAKNEGGEKEIEIEHNYAINS